MLGISIVGHGVGGYGMKCGDAPNGTVKIADIRQCLLATCALTRSTLGSLARSMFEGGSQATQPPGLSRIWISTDLYTPNTNT